MSDSQYEAGISEAAASGKTALTHEETDTLGEVGNICMGTVATTMYTLMDRRVEITTPHVTLHTTRELLSMYPIPFVIVEVQYTDGVTGNNLLLLKVYDAAMIADVMMGGDGTSVEQTAELSELQMSALNEIMNQIIGSSATALSKVIGRAVNIAPPISQQKTLESETDGVLGTEDVVILITFDMEIEGLLKSQLIQVMPLDQGREISAMLVEQNRAKHAAAHPLPPPASDETPYVQPADQAEPPRSAAQTAGRETRRRAHHGSLVDVRRMRFEPLDAGNAPETQERVGDMSLINNIPLSVSAELGATRKNLGDVLDFDIGSVIMLNKVAGDPVEVLVNGKLVAAGEVVVIDENYGVRITHLPSG